MARVKLPAIPPEMAPYRAQTAHLTPRVAGRMPPSTETMAELKKPEAGPSMRGEKALRGDSPHHPNVCVAAILIEVVAAISCRTQPAVH